MWMGELLTNTNTSVSGPYELTNFTMQYVHSDAGSLRVGFNILQRAKKNNRTSKNTWNYLKKSKNRTAPKYNENCLDTPRPANFPR